MPFGEVEVKDQQLWKKITRLRKEKDDLQGIIDGLRSQVVEMSDYENLKAENEKLKKDNANLKRSNTQLKNKYQD